MFPDENLSTVVFLDSQDVWCIDLKANTHIKNVS